jgi:hypothetical protein
LEAYSFGQTQLLPRLNPFPTNGLPGGWEHRLTGKFVAVMIYELQDNVKIELIINLDKLSAQSPTMTDCSPLKSLILQANIFLR